MKPYIPPLAALTPQAIKAIKNGELAIEEIRVLETVVNEYHGIKRKGFKRALLITVCIFIFFIAVSIPQMLERGTPGILFALLFTGVGLAACMAYVKWRYVDAMPRQFKRAVRKGYPDFNFAEKNGA